MALWSSRPLNCSCPPGSGRRRCSTAKLRIGFALTEKLLDFLHQLDIVGPSDGSKARKMRVSADDQEAVMMKLAVAVEGPVCQQEHLWGQPGQQPGALDGLTGGRTEGRTEQAACVGLTQHGQP
ncbi:hypothetical protein [Streptomyces mirabilis]|uniref:hypothetical protein n=1 Tax=Streptomyces mirabilis TaxID=68239 RepID=UPI0035DB5D86